MWYIVALAACVVLLWHTLPLLETMQEGYVPAGAGLTVLCGVGLALLLTALNGAAIRRKIGALERMRK